VKVFVSNKAKGPKQVTLNFINNYTTKLVLRSDNYKDHSESIPRWTWKILYTLANFPVSTFSYNQQFFVQDIFKQIVYITRNFAYFLVTVQRTEDSLHSCWLLDQDSTKAQKDHSRFKIRNSKFNTWNSKFEIRNSISKQPIKRKLLN
jgi:hypothetical protein